MSNSIFKILNFFEKRKQIIFVDSDKEIPFVKSTLHKEKILGLDTEFDWRNTYFPILSILQIATKRKIFLIDCITLKNLNWLKKILESNKRLIIFHACRSDATVLKSNLSFKITNSFDIQIAEKNINGGQVENYATLVKKYINKSIDKSETNSNWLRRPLTKGQIKYASDDVNYLIEIYKSQTKTLKKHNLLKKTFKDSAEEVFLGNQSLKRLRLKKNESRFSEKEKKIFLWREELAEENNVPPSFIFKNKDLKKLAKIESSEENYKKRLMIILGDNKIINDFQAKFL